MDVMGKKKTHNIKKVRRVVYLSTLFVFAYLTYQVIRNSYVAYFKFGYIDFSRDEISNYSSLLSVLFGLLGVILLVETLWMQFNEIENVKKDKERQEKIEVFNKMKLLFVDLEALDKDIEHRAEKIKEYIDIEKGYPFGKTMIKRTSLNRFNRFSVVDRISIFKGFNFFLNHRSDWLKEFNELYNLIEFIPDFFHDLYKRADEHTKDQYQKRLVVVKEMDSFMEFTVQLLLHFKGIASNESVEISKQALNKFYNKYNEMIGLNEQELVQEEEEVSSLQKETNFIELNRVLKTLIQELLALKSGDFEFFKVYIDKYLRSASEIRKSIYRIKQSGLYFIENLEAEYN